MPPDDVVAGLDREAAAARHEGLELRVWLRMLTCVQMIEGTVRARLRASFDTTLPRFDVLAQLDAAERHGGSGPRTTMTMGELSSRLMVTSGNVTGLIDAMEREGLVARQPHPTDRRSTLIGLTDGGRTLFARMAPVHAGWIDDLMAGMSDAEARTLLRLLGRLKESAQGGGRDA